MVNLQQTKLAPGLYLIATPIGTARDITLRALDILASADVLVAEDTRSLRKLMEIHGIGLGDRPMLSYHDHNGAQMRPRLLALLGEGKSMVYASEAGTPMVADPGFDLARVARAEGHDVTSAPGASAVITALTLAGLPTDRFFFAGFLPNAKGQRKTALAAVKDVPGTLAFYESPKRVAAMLADAAEVLGPERDAAVCRELTKKFEEIIRAPLSELAEICKERSLKGEIVVLVDRGHLPNIEDSELELKLSDLLTRLSVRDASDQLAAETGIARRRIYQLALKLDHA
ncbi:Ribosomal RNA small subunit methyltransferase I [Thalassovita gelatinovora]|uniref:Ribosomal RNA small subunit methyltransferase I n=1 Tax=Thalassovita gelatinovora TaxID=53501 RepID=A0A0P1FCY3_THAGE|nr:16S rRNA (cytidine(1402)-2'-O)-methyltransferase [Thalassovita gelatinovora]QIZ80544.1 16S rRNA (cytidine(1402)-2'-O)-methyltransferase [Thalassovita gelatinovora]CUH66028.1 Ribosomal RNA small subunit methyltransferase I [Thalassovita gelatinovora]SEQ75722.1 16S rRNA (cytidine1402-2'-O)-methyltransferase [Thalassovita gelatinovora]